MNLGQFNAVRVSADTGVTVTNDTNHTIAGEGKWYAPLVNNGTVEGHSIGFENTTIENNATMTTLPGGGFSVLNTTVTQDPANGILLAGTNGNINLTNSTVINGRLQDMPGTTFSGFYANNAHLTNVHNEARINVPAGNSLSIEGSTFVNDGPITVNNNHLSSATKVRFLDDVLLDGSGEIWLNQVSNAALLTVEGGGMLTQVASHTIHGMGRIDATKFINHGTVTDLGIINCDVENDGTMTSLGEINGDVVNQGTLGGALASSPLQLNGTLTGTGPLEFIQINGTHAPGNSPAKITVAGQYAVGATGTLSLEIAGTTAGTEFDQISVVPHVYLDPENVELDGTLSVHLADIGSGLFVPTVGDTFKVITVNSALATVMGTFDTEDLPRTTGGRGLTWLVHYNPRDVTLELTYALTGDYNGNGVVDAPDYTVWRDSLGQMGSGLAADGNGDNKIDAADFGVWKSNFGQSAPGAGAGSLDGAQVPEPACWLLLLVSMTMSLTARRKFPHRSAPRCLDGSSGAGTLATAFGSA